MADHPRRRRNRDLHHIRDLVDIGKRAAVALIVLGALFGYALGARALFPHCFGG